jgi:diadenosine tetraphosphatase ApaH/serine/threonine PP2A family protein phosphatase
LPASLSEAELEPLVTGHDAAIVVYGHVHNAFVRNVQRRTVINTGSTGNPTDGDNRASYAVLDVEGGSVGYILRRVPYDIDKTVAVAKHVDLPYLEQYTTAIRSGTAM